MLIRIMIEIKYTWNKSIQLYRSMAIERDLQFHQKLSGYSLLPLNQSDAMLKKQSFANSDFDNDVRYQ